MKVAITRPREKSEDTVNLVKAKGWEALIVPTVEIKPRKDALKGVDLAEHDWLVLTSSAGAEIVLEHYKDEVKKVKIACIGSKTAKELRRRGFEVAFTPKEFEAKALAEELLKRGAEGSKILVARASIGREVLVKVLRSKAEVTEIPIYDTVMTTDTAGIRDFSRGLDNGEVDAVIFTSSQAAKNLISSMGEKGIDKLNRLIVCAIGPITAETLKEKGVRVDVIPEEYTVKACLDELERHRRN